MLSEIPFHGLAPADRDVAGGADGDGSLNGGDMVEVDEKEVEGLNSMQLFVGGDAFKCSDNP